ncbi:hypothetical protein Bca101_051172 [Brassica carinata]
MSAYVEKLEENDTPDDMNYETQKVNNSSSLSRGFVKAALNLGCMSQCVYQHGDGHAKPYPTLAKCYESYKDLPTFQNAIPEMQPDAPVSAS